MGARAVAPALSAIKAFSEAFFNGCVEGQVCRRKFFILLFGYWPISIKR
jgi:hypothetical protein